MKLRLPGLLALVTLGFGCHKEKPYGSQPLAPGVLVTGEAALGDWSTDAPGGRRLPAKIAAPFSSTKDAGSRPSDAASTALKITSAGDETGVGAAD